MFRLPEQGPPAPANGEVANEPLRVRKGLTEPPRRRLPACEEAQRHEASPASLVRSSASLSGSSRRLSRRYFGHCYATPSAAGQLAKAGTL